MRLPRTAFMDSLIGKSNYSLVNYINSRVSATKRISLIKYIFSDPNNPLYFNHVQRLSKDPRTDDPFHTGAGLFAQQDPDKVWQNATEDFITRLNTNYAQGVQEVASYRQSVRDYLATSKGFGSEEIDWLETFEDATGHYDLDLAEIVLEDWIFGIGQNLTWVTLDGGMSRLVEGLTSILKTPIRYSQRVNAIRQTSRGKKLKISTAAANTSFSYDHVINTVPLGAMQAMDMDSLQLGYKQSKAIREIHYDDSMKIGVKFKTRWWQGNEITDPFKGGQGFCDLPIRKVAYPSYGVDSPNAPGVLIASYVCSVISTLPHGQKHFSLQR